MDNIGVLFREFYKDLRAHKNVIIYQHEKRHFPMLDYDAFLKSIPPSLLTSAIRTASFLKNAPELVTLYWGYKLNDNEENGGEYNLYHLLNALASNAIAEPPDRSDSDLPSLVWIDSHLRTGDGVQILLDTTKWPNWQNLELFLLDVNGKLHALTINYEEYMNFTYITKGFYNWQYLFIKDKSVVSADKKQLMATHFLPMKQVLPILFPSVDYSDLFKRIDQF